MSVGSASFISSEHNNKSTVVQEGVKLITQQKTGLKQLKNNFANIASLSLRGKSLV